MRENNETATQRSVVEASDIAKSGVWYEDHGNRYTLDGENDASRTKLATASFLFEQSAREYMREGDIDSAVRALGKYALLQPALNAESFVV